MGVLDGQAVSAAVTNAAFLAKNANDSTSYNLAFGAIINFPKNVISTAGTINALSTVKSNVKLTGASVVLNGATAGADGQVLFVYNGTGSSITINSLSGSASAADQFKLVSSSYSLPNGGGIFFVYDSTLANWVVIGTMDSMTATDQNTASTIVKRDASGNFIASQASLSSLLLRGSTSGTVTVSPPATVTSYALTLPSVQGASQTTLVNDGSGALTWGTVGSGGSKNYFSVANANATFTSNTVSPWSACTLTLSSGIPSGAPTLTATQMAISTTASNPLLVSSSLYNLQMVKSAANAQGQGFISGALTVDREDLAKVLTGSFTYEVVSGTVDFSGTSTQSLEIWVYNTVSGAWTQPQGYRGMNQASGQGIVTFTFQTDSTAANNSYRIAIITAQTSTSNYTVNFNDFKVGPSAMVLGAAMTDWQAYTPTFQGFGTPSAVNMFWRRVGDSVEIEGKFTVGTPTAVEARVGIPFTSSDTSKIPSIQIAGVAGITANASTYFGLYALMEPSVAYITLGQQTSTTAALTKTTGSAINPGSITITIRATVPVQGWSSNVQMSSDTDTRVVAFAANKTAAQSIPNNSYTVIDFNSVEINTHGSTYAAGAYTVPVSGYYRVSFNFNFSSGTGGTIFALLNKNGVGFSRVSTQAFSTSQSGGTGSTVLYLNAGENVSLSVIQLTGAAQTLEAAGRFSVERLSGPSVIASTETVAEIRENRAGSTIGTTVTKISYPTIIKSTHSSWDSTNNRFVAPVSGTYSVSVIAQGTSAGSERPFEMYATVNGSASWSMTTVKREPNVASTFGAYGDRYTNNMAGLVPMNAGDYLEVFAISPNGTLSLYTPAGANKISIIRGGN